MSTSELVAETLRQEILRGELRPGQALLQESIAARFAVSQGSVREALRRLETSALVTSIRNRGTFVTTLTAEQIEEMYDVRLAVELLALRNNFSKLSPARLAAARALLDRTDDPQQVTFIGEANKTFHAIFYGDAARTLSSDILQNIYGNLTRIWADFIKRNPELARRYEKQSRREHRQLLAAAAANDLDSAVDALTRHITGARKLLIKHLPALESGQDQPSESVTEPVAAGARAPARKKTGRSKAGSRGSESAKTKERSGARR